MRVVIVGAGAVGGFFGGRLGEAGADVAFLARARTLEALDRDGLHISSPAGDFHLPRVEASADASDLGPADAVIVAVKAWQVAGIARSLRPLLHAGTCVLPLQNGVEAPAHLIRELGRGPVLGGLCKVLSEIEVPGRVRHLGGRAMVALGELDDRRSERVERLRQLLEEASVKAEVPANIEAAMWEKFLFICAASGLGAATRMPIGILRESAETRALLTTIMEEIRQVAIARDIPVASDIVPRTLKFIDAMPAGATASMQRDLMAGRASELEAQLGAVVRLGREDSVPTPVNELLYHVLLPQERLARSG